MTETSINRNYKLILECAAELIMEQGCINTTLQQIMDRSGLSKGAIYHYVKSKEELFGQLLAMQLDEVNDAFQAAVRQNGNLEGPLHAIAEGLAILQREDGLANLILTYLISRADKPRIGEALHHYHERCVTMARHWIEAGQQAGVISHALDASRTAEGFITVSYGMWMRNLLAGKDGKAEGSKFDQNEFYRYMLTELKD